MPSVQRAHEAYRKSGVVVLAISIDGTGARSVQPFISKNKYTVPTLLDPEMEVARSFGVRGVPTTVVVDRQGAIVATGFGPMDFDSTAFRNYIKALAAKKG